jgi:hypothetical protein
LPSNWKFSGVFMLMLPGMTASIACTWMSTMVGGNDPLQPRRRAHA